MEKSKKAALFSAIIFPGAGLWWLKHYVQAFICIVPSGILLCYIIAKVYGVVVPVYLKMRRLAEEGLIDITNLPALYLKLLNEINAGLAAQQDVMRVAEALLIAFWLGGIVWSYFVGKKLQYEGSQSKESKIGNDN